MPPSKAIFGYDTRSPRSALVMAAIDLLNPCKRPRSFAWRSPLVVSSIAGLGDLFIHLPLISGIVNRARAGGFEVRVALRHAHAEIGRSCGWEVLEFDNGLEDFFKNPSALQVAEFLRTIRETRHQPADLWIDLTGSAVSTLAIKMAGARNLAARTTRGGRSFIDHPLPHNVGENEYANIDRVGKAIGCTPDHDVFDRLRGELLSDYENSVVLCLTTACRWRNWPLQNFLALVDQFPALRFVATGIRAEVMPEEQNTLALLLRRDNVECLMDQMSVTGLIQLIANSRAVVTNDTSTAHIANAFRKPGAVLFGPAGPDKLAPPYGLRPFVDTSCPFHPCVQWKCANPDNWCMRKIQAREVAAHLASVITAAVSTVQRSATEPTSYAAYQPDWQRQAQLPV